MPLTVAVRVPVEDVQDLQTLLAQSATDAEIRTSRPFDGETVLQVVLLLTGAGYPVLRTWLQSRTDNRKTFSIVHNGTELRGYTPEEAERVIAALDQLAADSSAPSRADAAPEEPTAAPDEPR